MWIVNEKKKTVVTGSTLRHLNAYLEARMVDQKRVQLGNLKYYRPVIAEKNMKSDMISVFNKRTRPDIFNRAL